VSKDSKPSPFAFDRGEISAMLQRLAEAPGKTYEGVADNLVRVRVDGAMRVLSIEILDPGVDRRICSALETAAVAAVNLALQKAALAAGDAVAALDQKSGGPAA
jgi:DNA-binding protein YbaB